MYDTTESTKRVNMDPPPDATIRRAFDDFDRKVGTGRGLTDADRQALEDDAQARALAEWRARNGDGSGSYVATWAAVWFALGVGALWLGGLL